MVNMVRIIFFNYTDCNILVLLKNYGHMSHTPLITANGLISLVETNKSICGYERGMTTDQMWALSR